MEFGLGMFLTDETIGPVDLARAAEAAGFESLFVPEHTHVPVRAATPRPGGGDAPGFYARGYDPFVALSAAAAVTERLRLGTAVCLVVQHDPIALAKRVASLDHLSGGRVLLGVGAGWNREEMRNHGTDPDTRFRLMRERVLAMREIWTRDEAEFHGRLVDFDPIRSWPKPVQPGGPPVLVGGNDPRNLDRVLAWGDGWIPNTRNLDRLAAGIADLHGRAAGAGRPSPPVTLFGAAPDDGTVEALAAAGVARCVFLMPPSPAGEARARVHDLAALAGRHR